MDNQTLQLVLRHDNFSKADQEEWLENLDEKQQALEENAYYSGDPSHDLVASLYALKVKACKHTIRTLNEEAYEEVAQVSIELYRALHREIEQFLKTPYNPEEFFRNCMNLIEKSSDILAPHRGGLAQLLVNIVSAILAVITFKFIRSDSHQWDFFEMKTASIQIVENFMQTLFIHSKPQNNFATSD